MATKQVENRDFLDFTDFFRLLKDSMTSSHSNEDVFIELVSVIYEEAGVSLVSPKDDVSDICRKKKAFNPQVRNVADNFILDKIMDTIKSAMNISTSVKAFFTFNPFISYHSIGFISNVV